MFTAIWVAGRKAGTLCVSKKGCWMLAASVVALLSSPHDTNDGTQKSPTNKGCCPLANDGAPVVEAAQGWDRKLKQQ
jgi:hypothetical protein